MGFAAGIGIPLILLLLLEFFNTKITDRRYLEANLKAPLLVTWGIIPAIRRFP
jgi:capsular polysaccharide biosynthesis protein